MSQITAYRAKNGLLGLSLPQLLMLSASHLLDPAKQLEYCLSLLVLVQIQSQAEADL